jgi:hypothetical protein
MARCTRYNIVWCWWPATGRWFSPGTPVYSTNKTDHHDITEILLKVALNTINPNLLLYMYIDYCIKWKKTLITIIVIIKWQTEIPPVRTVPKSNWKMIEIEVKYIPLSHINITAHFPGFGQARLLKVAGFNKFYGPKPLFSVKWGSHTSDILSYL